MKFSAELCAVLDKAAAIYYDSDEIGCMNLLLAIAATPESSGGELLHKLGVSRPVAESYFIPSEPRCRISAAAEAALAMAYREAEEAGGGAVCSHHLLVALIRLDPVETRQFFWDFRIEAQRLMPIIDAMNRAGVGCREEGVRVGRSMKNKQMEMQIIEAMASLKDR